jgi:hypothetical protein
MEQPHGGRKAGKRNCLYLGFSIILGPPLLTLLVMQVYQEKGLRDKEKYRNEMLEYRSSYAQ